MTSSSCTTTTSQLYLFWIRHGAVWCCGTARGEMCWRRAAAATTAAIPGTFLIFYYLCCCCCCWSCKKRNGQSWALLQTVKTWFITPHTYYGQRVAYFYMEREQQQQRRRRPAAEVNECPVCVLFLFFSYFSTPLHSRGRRSWWSYARVVLDGRSSKTHNTKSWKKTKMKKAVCDSNTRKHLLVCHEGPRQGVSVSTRPVSLDHWRHFFQLKDTSSRGRFLSNPQPCLLCFVFHSQLSTNLIDSQTSILLGNLSPFFDSLYPAIFLLLITFIAILS